MRRPRPHRLTGSARRLLAAACLAGLAAALLVGSAAKPVAAAGLDLDLGVFHLSLPSPLLPLPSGAVPAPSTAPPTLPSRAALPVCPPTCTPTSSGGAAGTADPLDATPGARWGGSSGHPAAPFRAAPGGGAGPSGSVGAPQSLGLAVSPPPPVEQLTPLAGISFGQAPYLWPLFALLDLIALCAVVLLVRRTWSPASSSD